MNSLKKKYFHIHKTRKSSNMKLWELESILQAVKPFEKPNIKLEQYLTTPHLAAHTLYTAAFNYEDIEDKVVLDLGTGTGMLAIASALCGASHVIGVDIDTDALRVAQENIEQCQVSDKIDLMNANVFNDLLCNKRWNIDTVVLNPPFGTRMKGADMHFLSIGAQIAKTAVYSLHKSSTRDFVTRTAEGWGCKVEVVAQLVYDLPKTYSFHKKNNEQIEVDLIRLEKTKGKLKLQSTTTTTKKSTTKSSTSKKSSTTTVGKKKINSSSSQKKSK
jgi:predicted RNA methylase